MYKANHAFWAERPLTAKMVEWAAGDICELFCVRMRQLVEAEKRCCTARAVEESENFLNAGRSASLAHVTIPMELIGQFIGPRGANIRRIQKRFKVLLYQRGARSGAFGTFVVFHHGEQSLAKVQSEINAL